MADIYKTAMFERESILDGQVGVFKWKAYSVPKPYRRPPPPVPSPDISPSSDDVPDLPPRNYRAYENIPPEQVVPTESQIQQNSIPDKIWNNNIDEAPKPVRSKDIESLRNMFESSPREDVYREQLRKQARRLSEQLPPPIRMQLTHSKQAISISHSVAKRPTMPQEATSPDMPNGGDIVQPKHQGVKSDIPLIHTKIIKKLDIPEPSPVHKNIISKKDIPETSPVRKSSESKQLNKTYIIQRSPPNSRGDNSPPHSRGDNEYHHELPPPAPPHVGGKEEVTMVTDLELPPPPPELLLGAEEDDEDEDAERYPSDSYGSYKNNRPVRQHGNYKRSSSASETLDPSKIEVSQSVQPKSRDQWRSYQALPTATVTSPTTPNSPRTFFPSHEQRRVSSSGDRSGDRSCDSKSTNQNGVSSRSKSVSNSGDAAVERPSVKDRVTNFEVHKKMYGNLWQSPRSSPKQSAECSPVRTLRKSYENLADSTEDIVKVTQVVISKPNDYEKKQTVKIEPSSPTLPYPGSKLNFGVTSTKSATTKNSADICNNTNYIRNDLGNSVIHSDDTIVAPNNYVRNDLVNHSNESSVAPNSARNDSGVSLTNSIDNCEKPCDTTNSGLTNGGVEIIHRRNKSQEELECEKHAEVLAAELPESDKRLCHVISPPQNNKSTMDYMSGLFRTTSVRRVGTPTRLPSSKHDSSSSSDCSRKIDDTSIPANSPYWMSPARASLENSLREGDNSAIFDDIHDKDELSLKKEELMSRIMETLEILKEEKSALDEEIEDNNNAGKQVQAAFDAKCPTITERDRYKSYVTDLEKIVRLLLKLSGLLARADNAVNSLPANADQRQRTTLVEKKERLCSQHEEAKQLKIDIDKRHNLVSASIKLYLGQSDHETFVWFTETKSQLMIEEQELKDKITLGEEQLLALKRSITDL